MIIKRTRSFFGYASIPLTRFYGPSAGRFRPLAFAWFEMDLVDLNRNTGIWLFLEVCIILRESLNPSHFALELIGPIEPYIDAHPRAH